MNNRPARDIMTTPVITIRGEELISNFIDMLLKNGINGIPVVDEKGQLEGIATRTDLFAFELKRELGSLYEKKLHQIFKEHMNVSEWSSFEEMIGKFNRTITVRDIMVKELITAGEETPVKDICRMMKNKKINHIIITSSSKIAGIITARDIIGLVADED
jgi:CBS domain-containing protein